MNTTINSRETNEYLRHLLFDADYKRNLEQPFQYEGIDISLNVDQHTDRVKLFNNLNLEGRLLDAGCNMGYNSFLLKKNYPRLQITAVDIVPECIVIANVVNKHLGYDIKFEVGDIKKISNVQEYDYILMSFLARDLEDFKYTEKILEEKKFEGIVLLLYPNWDTSVCVNRVKNIKDTLEYYKDKAYLMNELLISVKF